MSNQTEDLREPSQEELIERRKQLMDFYKKELPLLRLRKEYEESIAAIEIAKMQVLEIMIAKSQMSSRSNQAGDPDPNKESSPEQEEHFVPVNKEN